MMSKLQAHMSHSAEKAHDDENASHVTSVLVTALCNQPEAFALDLGADLCNKCMRYCFLVFQFDRRRAALDSDED